MKHYLICPALLCLLFCLIALPAVNQDIANANPDYEVMFWESVRDSNDIDMYRAYVKKYPNGHFVPIAKIKIHTLSRKAPETEPNTEHKIVTSKPKAPVPAKRLKLRSKPEKLLERDLRDCIKKYNFSVAKRNPQGRFKNAFVDNQDGTITDNATGLIWQKSSSTQRLNRYRAKRYIENLNWEKFAGRSDWRLPTLEELLSLMEHESQDPLWFYIDPIFYDPNNRFMADRVWSSDKKEPIYRCRKGGWAANFWRGTIIEADWENYMDQQMPYSENFVKAVRVK